MIILILYIYLLSFRPISLSSISFPQNDYDLLSDEKILPIILQSVPTAIKDGKIQGKLVNSLTDLDLSTALPSSSSSSTNGATNSTITPTSTSTGSTISYKNLNFVPHTFEITLQKKQLDILKANGIIGKF